MIQLIFVILLCVGNLNALTFKEKAKKNARMKLDALPLSEQVKKLSTSDPARFQQFLKKHPEIIYIQDLKIPEGLGIAKARDGHKIVAYRNFKRGDLVYENDTLYFPGDKQILVQVEGEFVLLDNLMHTVNRGNEQREFFYFDSFMNHSCDPNTISFYLTSSHYEGRALHPISVGDELTCDYAVFNTKEEGGGFQCHCGSPNCRGYIE